MTELIPAAALENHIAILGKTGSGKSNVAKVLAEKLMDAGERVCVIDPTGTWFGLRLMANGKPSPYHPVIFGGEHGDLPLSELHGPVIGEAIGTSSDSAIIDTRALTVGQRVRFFTGFAETLLRLNRGPLHLIVDEAHIFMPQGKTDVEGGKMLHAGNNMVSLGRGVGLRIMLISQRPQKLAKDSLTQAETLIAMRVMHPLDRKAYEDWISEQGDSSASGKEIVDSLASLPTGDAWVWSPLAGFLKRVHFPLARTFDSGKPLSRDQAAPELAPLDTTALGDKMDSIRQEAQANDPKRLKARIAELERERADERANPLVMVDESRVVAEYKRGRMEGYEQGVAQGQALALGSAADRLAEVVSQFTAEAERRREQTADFAKRQIPPVRTIEPKVRVVAAKPVQNVTQPVKRSIEADTGISPSSIKLVDAIVAAYPIGMSLETAAKRAGLSKRSSAFGRYLKEAAASPRIQDRGDGRYVAVAAEEGLQAPSGLDDFKRSLPPSYAKMLEVLADAPSSVILADEIAERSGVSRTSSGLNAGLKELVALGLADRTDGGYRLSQDFV